MGRASGWQCHRMAQGGGNSPVTITAKAVESENCHKKLQLKLPQKISANEQKKNHFIYLSNGVEKYYFAG